MTESEKIVADTLRRLEKEERITWGHRFEAQVHGKFRTPAPIDFLIVFDGLFFPVEIKETGSNSIPLGNFKEEQRRLLHALPNTLLVLRYFSSEYTRRSSHYWEYYFLVDAKDWCPPVEVTGGGVKLSSMFDSQSVEELASHEHGVKQGFGEVSGLTSRGNDIQGLERMHEALTRFKEDL